MNNSANDFGTVLVTSGNAISVVDANALTLGTSAMTSLTAQTLSGDLTLAGNLTATGSGDSIVLAAAGNFNNSGTYSLNPGAGRWLVYSTSPAGSTEGGLTSSAGSAMPRLYNRTYGSNPPGSISESGNHLIYSFQPSLTVTPNNLSKVYGANDPTQTYTTSAFITDDGVTDTATTAGLTSFARVAGESVGTRAITQGGFTSNAGYGITFVTGNTLTITPASLTASVANQNKVYGADDPSLPFAASLTGLVNRTVSTWGGNVVVNDSALTSTASALTRAGGESVGAYNITAGTFSTPSTNYSAPTFTGTPTLTIGTASLTASVANQNKVYGADDPSLAGIAVTMGGAINRTVSNWNGANTVINDTGNVGATLTSLSRSAGETVAGGPYSYTGATFNALTGSAASNYTATLATGRTLSITPRPVSIAADSQSKIYGSSDPALTYTLGGSGLANNPGIAVVDTQASVISGAQARSPGETVLGGPYAITQGTLAANSNYSVTSYTGGNLNVTTASLSVTADDKSKVSGDANPAFTASYGGLKFADTPALVGAGLQFATPATTASPAGNYAINPFGLNSSDYSISYLSGNLRVDDSNLSNISSVQSVLSSLNISGIQRSLLPDFISYANGTPIVFTQPPIVLSNLDRALNPDDIDSLPATAAGSDQFPVGQSQRVFDRNVACSASTPIQAFSCR